MDSNSKLLSQLDEQQLEAALALIGPVCVIAGAGSGKTRTISHRIAYGVETGIYDAEKVLALSYTNRAAAELRDRLAGLGVTGVNVRTFHSAALAQLRYFWPQFAGVPAPSVMPSKAKVIASAAKQLGFGLDQSGVREVAAEIEWRKYTLRSIDQYKQDISQRKFSLAPKVMLTLINEYEEQKIRSSQVDWEDVLVLTLGLLRTEQRANEHVRSQFRFITVDEYQDISPLQQALLEQWLGDRSDVCVVGDPRQTIYSFAGASPDFIHSFSSRFPNGTSIQLTNNYRSSSEIVALANSISDATALDAVSKLTGRVQAKAFDSNRAEVDFLVSSIRSELESGSAASDIAVLFRINSQAVELARALSEAQIRFVLKTGERFFQLPAVSQLVQAFRAQRFNDAPLHQIIFEVLSSAGWQSEPTADLEKWESLQALYEICVEVEGTIADLISHLEEKQLQQYEPVREVVTLSTIHASKGLEWKSVFVMGASADYLPFVMSKTEAEIAEEKRLCYVAVTRAKRNLILSYAPTAVGPSPFLAGLFGSRN